MWQLRVYNECSWWRRSDSSSFWTVLQKSKVCIWTINQSLTEKINLAFTHHGASGVRAGRGADLRGESQSPSEASWAGQLPIQSCVGHHAKMSRVWTGGHRHGTAESWGGRERGRRNWRMGWREEQCTVYKHRHSHRGTEKNGKSFVSLNFVYTPSLTPDQEALKSTLYPHY